MRESERLVESDALERVADRLVSRVPVVDPAATVEAVRAQMHGRRFESVAAVAVCEDRRLVGIVRAEDLIAADARVSVRELMDTNPPVVVPGVDQEVAAWRAVQHGEATLAVVDGDGIFVGFVPPHRLLEVLLQEHDEDLARLGGFMASSAGARRASEETVWLRFRHRLPWLLLGLGGALASADLVASFEDTLRRNVVLAFFVPGVVYMADAVGTQTEALVIRGLSVGVSIRKVVRRELLTGLLVGAVIATAFVPVGLWRWGDPGVTLAVGVALLAACSTATVVALVLPWLLGRTGRDPAFGSGPLATVVQDLLSVLIYLSVATAVVR